MRLLGRATAGAAAVALLAVAAALGVPAASPADPLSRAGSGAGSGERTVLSAAAPDPSPLADPRALAEPDLLDLEPGTFPVARTGEDGLWMSWALVDTATGTGPGARWTGSANAAAERTEAESAIKAWLAADTLRSATEDGRAVTAGERSAIRDAIRSSDDDAAERLYRAGGTEAMIGRLEPECGVEVSTSRRGWWSYTQLGARDAAGMLGCVREHAPEWPGGADLLADLAAIDADGRSGVAEMVPGTSSEKNGWTVHGDTWNVNCVVAWEDRSLAVLTRFPAERGLDYGWGVCRDVATDVLGGRGV